MKVFTISLLALCLMGVGAHAQTDTGVVKINLGTADKFALLGGSGVTNVSAQTYIIGDVGSSPTPAITGLTQSQVKGRLFLKASPVTAQAQKDLTVAYDEAAGTHMRHRPYGQGSRRNAAWTGSLLLLVVSRIDRYADARCSRQSRFPVGFPDRQHANNSDQFQSGDGPGAQSATTTVGQRFERVQCVLAGWLLSYHRHRSHFCR